MAKPTESGRIMPLALSGACRVWQNAQYRMAAYGARKLCFQTTSCANEYRLVICHESEKPCNIAIYFTLGVMSTQPSLSPPPIPTELQAEWPDQHKLREQLLSLYEQYSGEKLRSPTPTAKEMEAVVQWLNQNAETFLPHYHRRRVALVPAFSPSLTAKISSLAQFHCPICATKDGLFPVHTIPIRITPVSKQAISQVPKKRAAFERAIRHRFKDHKNPFPPDRAICLLIVFVVKAKGAQKDLDNMAKAIVDALKNVLFGDDRRIDHLNIIRIKSPDEEFVYLNIRQTELNEHNDVLVPRMLHSWAGAEVLSLEDFIEP